jgi:two-component system response regulator AtoC
VSHGVLVIEDETTLARNLKRYLEKHDYSVRLAESGEEGLAKFTEFNPDLVLLDYHLPGADGLETLHRIRRLDPRVKIIIITAHGSVELAVNAMKSGAWDYLSKPLVLGELKLLLDRALSEERIQSELSYYRGKDALASGLAKILGESPPIVRLKQRIVQLIEAERRLERGPPAPVLITGETGTGKELVARSVHFDGARCDRPFVEINCASIPKELLESELFGYERGAFTDARQRKLGLVESAHGGTLFLDEIGEMDPAVQTKLLKLLEDRTVRRLGSLRDREVDIRVIAATNQRLDRLVREGGFRADLYYRLWVVHLEVPPLRDRGDDAVLLARHFLAHHARRYRKPELTLSPSSEALIQDYPWPGNVRELHNIMEQAVLLANGPTVEPADLPIQRQAPGEGESTQGALEHLVDSLPTNGVNLDAVERKLIARTLQRSGWNVTQAAERLGISRDTLRYRIEKHGLKPPS